MAIIKCKMCGGDLELIEGQSVAECEYCGSRQTVPNQDNEKKLQQFQRADWLRRNCEFDRAAAVYESIVAEFREESEAYWGLILCKYGIEYVDDPGTGKKIPTCHRSSFDSVMEDPSLELAMDYADAVARRVYREEAKQIEELRKGIVSVSANEQPYDIFICYKETDEKGDRTLDSVLAQDIYDALNEKGYRVFFARISLEDKLGVEYEPYIFAALNSAKIMLAVGTDYEYYNAVWVKNEWGRFLKLMAQDKTRHLIPCYKNIDAYDMPKEFAKLQAQDLGKVGAMQDLLRGIEKILGPQVGTFAAKKAATNAGAMVMRGQFALDDGDWAKADEYFERALDENPQDAKAYVGKVLVGLHLSAVEQISDHFVKLQGDKNFERAIRFSSGADKAQLESIKEQADRKWNIKRVTVVLKKIAKYKECEEILDEIKRNTARGTVESYRKAADLCRSARYRGIGAMFTSPMEDSYKRQSEIIRLFSATYKEYTVEEIKKSPYFSGKFLSKDELRKDLRQMIIDGSVEQGSIPNAYCIAGAKEKLRDQRRTGIYNEQKSRLEQSNSVQTLLNAAESLEFLGDYKDAPGLARMCREKAALIIIEQKDKEYEEVLLIAKNSSAPEELDGCVKRFGFLGDFRDSKTLAAHCRKRAEEIREEIRQKEIAEKARLAEEAERQLIARSKAERESAAKKKKIAMILAGAAAAVLAVFLLVSQLIIPASYYNKAEALAVEDKSVEAALIYGKAGNYRDARSLSRQLWSELVNHETTCEGSLHVIKLKEDGSTEAVWGSNLYGECDVTAWSDIVSISAGYWHTVGLKADGTVVAVGGNDYGQIKVRGWRDIVAISAYGDITLGLKTDGTVVAAGNNKYGQCNVSGWRNIVAIATNGYHTVGLKADGTVVAVGDNEYGQCDVSDWTDIVAVATGFEMTMGLKADGTVVVVGSDYLGQNNLSGWKGIKIPD